MTTSLNKAYLLELFSVAIKTEMLELFQSFEDSNLDSKEIRRQKKKLNEMSNNIDEGLRDVLSSCDYFYEYNESFEIAVSKRKLRLKILLDNCTNYLEFLNRKANSLMGSLTHGLVSKIVEYFTLVKEIYSNELSNIQNVLDNNRERKLKIVDGALYYANTQETELEIGDDVLEIKPYAFYMNPYIERIKISSTKIKQINSMTFVLCPNLKEIIISDNIDTFDHMAIYNCPKLDYLELPKNIENIYYDSISYCAGLITLFKIEGKYNVVNNTLMESNNIILTANAPILPNIASLGTFSFVNNPCLAIQIPKSVKTIETGAFISSDIYEIIIPETVTDIKTMAFVDCNNLTRVVILNKQLSFENSSFIFCPNLKEIVCPKQFQGKIDNLVESNSEMKFIYY